MESMERFSVDATVGSKRVRSKVQFADGLSLIQRISPAQIHDLGSIKFTRSMFPRDLMQNHTLLVTDQQRRPDGEDHLVLLMHLPDEMRIEMWRIVAHPASSTMGDVSLDYIVKDVPSMKGLFVMDACVHGRQFGIVMGDPDNPRDFLFIRSTGDNPTVSTDSLSVIRYRPADVQYEVILERGRILACMMDPGRAMVWSFFLDGGFKIVELDLKNGGSIIASRTFENPGDRLSGIDTSFLMNPHGNAPPFRMSAKGQSVLVPAEKTDSVARRTFPGDWWVDCGPPRRASVARPRGMDAIVMPYSTEAAARVIVWDCSLGNRFEAPMKEFLDANRPVSPGLTTASLQMGEVVYTIFLASNCRRGESNNTIRLALFSISLAQIHHKMLEMKSPASFSPEKPDLRISVKSNPEVHIMTHSLIVREFIDLPAEGCRNLVLDLPANTNEKTLSCLVKWMAWRRFGKPPGAHALFHEAASNLVTMFGLYASLSLEPLFNDIIETLKQPLLPPIPLFGLWFTWGRHPRLENHPILLAAMSQRGREIMQLREVIDVHPKINNERYLELMRLTNMFNRRRLGDYDLPTAGKINSV